MNALANHTQRIKNVIHGVQGFAIFIGWAVTIAVFTKPGTSGGGSKYYFALVRGPCSAVGHRTPHRRALILPASFVRTDMS